MVDDPVNFIDPNGHGLFAGLIGLAVGAIAGGVTAALEGESLGDIGKSVLAGAATGGLAGLTFGASLLAEGGAGTAAYVALNVGVKGVTSATIEAGRELATGKGCLSAGGILTAGALGGLGEGVGVGFNRAAAPLGKQLADAWGGIAGATASGGQGLAIAAGQANARAENYRP